MSVLSVLGGLATVAGKGFEGYGVDQQLKVKQALAQREAERQARQDKITGLLDEARTRELNAPKPKDYKFFVGADGTNYQFDPETKIASPVVGADQQAVKSPVTPHDPIMGSPEWKASKKYEASIAYHPPVQEPLVQVQQPDGSVTYVPRSQAVWKTAPGKIGGGGSSASGAQAPIDDMRARAKEITDHAQDLASGKWQMTSGMQMREGLTYGQARNAAKGTPSAKQFLLGKALDVTGTGQGGDFPRYQALMNSQRAFGDDAAKVFKGRQNEEAVLREVALAELTPDDYKNPTVVKQKLDRMNHIIHLAELTNPIQMQGGKTGAPSGSAVSSGDADAILAKYGIKK